MNSDQQSGSIFDLLGTLGTAYFGSQAVEAAAAGQKTGTLNSTGTPTTTPVATAAASASGQILPGIDNKFVYLGGALVLAVGVLIALRSR